MRVVLSAETFLPKIDGIVNIVCRTLDYLRENGVTTMIIAPEQGVRDYNGTSVIGAPCIVNPKYPEGRIGFPSLHAHNAIRAFQPDIVHAIDPVLIGLGAICSAKLLRIPTVASYHLSLSESMRTYGFPILSQPVSNFRVWAFNYVDHALAPSRNSQNMLRGLGVRRIGWWRRGVDSETFNPALRSESMRQRFGVTDKNEVVLLYVGRLAPDKQLDHIKPALEAVPNARLVLIGGGPSQKELQERFKGLPVSFMGYMRGKELATAYASADMFVFPSAHETFGLVLAEAIASGIPVISSRVGGAEDLIQQGETGYVFDVGDIPALVTHVKELAAQPERMRAMGSKGRAFAETLKWSGMMQELLSFYEDLLEEKGRLPTRITSKVRTKSPLWQPR